MANYNNFLGVDPIDKPGTRVTSVKKTSYGYRVQMFNHYVTLYYLKVIVNENKSAKIHWKVDKNYNPTERYTTYYNTIGNEITRKEYQQLNK
jgi:hypothetical protein